MVVNPSNNPRWYSTRLPMVAFAGFGALMGLIHLRLSDSLDLAILKKLQRYDSILIANTMAVVSWPGFPPQSRVLLLLVPLALWLRGFRLEASFQLLTCGASAVAVLIKLLTRRRRPNRPDLRWVDARVSGPSFPSGHVLSYVCVYGFLMHALPRVVKARLARRVLAAGLTGLVTLVGPSRVYEGHHWPTDVLASYLLGFAYLRTLSHLYDRAK